MLCAYNYCLFFLSIDVTVKGYLIIGIKNRHLEVTTLNTTLSLSSITSKITGFRGQDDDFYNQVIESFVPELVMTRQSEVTQAVSDMVLPRINEIFNKITLHEFLRMHRQIKPCKLWLGGRVIRTISEILQRVF